ncbi:HpcH/HpaI aldolase/citrate lyase family protein [Clostridium saudiense]|uniref:HpcH/HpaI aldolase/citrate lyase family protein n=2 Tax=Clostridium saudiense TaxID=1414720 RepID=A0ABS2FE44_9CLOT|nr:HpcH/HpaI aldolase/citrate lyase family protein [Clostridium saudiense]
MNGEKNFYEKIINGDFNELGAISICFEDATRDGEVEDAENNVVNMLDNLVKYIGNIEVTNNIPLIFFRVRNYNQFLRFTSKLRADHFRYITGFIFPKFTTKNSIAYLEYIKRISEKYNEVLYAMPILESEAIVYKETRIQELINIKQIIDDYSDIILNIRVGGTDFSSKFGLRRSIDSSIYNIRVVSDCLIDIINIFLRDGEDYVISAPVWEYFSEDIESKEVSGLINEIKSDKENGFCGKTIIHLSQIKYVNSLYTVTYEEYIDAKSIITSYEDGGVFKGYGGNKMNEVKPHFNWAKKVMKRAQIFGVLNEGISNEELYKESNFSSKSIEVL